MMKSILEFKKFIKDEEKIMITKKDKKKFMWKIISTFPYSLKLGNFISEHDYLKERVALYPLYPVFLEKLRKPYLMKKLKIKRKFNTIVETYNTLKLLFNENVLRDLYKNKRVPLCLLIGQNQELFFISLELYSSFYEEGEINLSLFDTSYCTITTIVFSFIKDEYGELNLFIGGIHSLEDGVVNMKAIVEELYGITTEELLIEVLYFIEKEVGVNFNKIGVGNTVYVGREAKEAKENFIDHDKIFRALNAERKEDGVWKLPKELKRVQLSRIPSNKRVEYERRKRFLNALEKRVSKFFKENEL